MSNEPTITCPSCKTEIKLTESLAAPLVESTRRAFEQRLAEKDLEFASKTIALKQQAEALQKEREGLDDQVASTLKREREKIAAEEAKKVRRALEDEMERKAKEFQELEGLLKERTEKLAKSQEAEAELKKKEREIEDDRRELNLTIEKRVAQEQQTIREKAKRDAEEELKLKMLEKEHTIASLLKQLDEAKRRAEQGSQQLQGEVQELDLESELKARFPLDAFQPVPKGEHGGDVLQMVNGPLGQPCGTILWESKRTKNWSDGWLSKLRDDQRAAKADLALIVSQVLPKDCDTFAYIDGVWVTHPRCAFPVTVSLRQTLIEVATVRQSVEGQETKMELVYQYLTGSRFRLRVQALIEVFATMSEDLEKEIKAIKKQWEKRRTQIERVVQATVGMYGDLQGIAGSSIQEIEGMSLSALESNATDK
jgi:hypothetical protein